MIQKSSAAKILTVTFLFSFIMMINGEISGSYGNFPVEKRREIFTSKHNLPEDDPDKLVMLLIAGLNDKDRDVHRNAVLMSAFTISGIQSRAQAGDPVA